MNYPCLSVNLGPGFPGVRCCSRSGRVPLEGVGPHPDDEGTEVSIPGVISRDEYGEHGREYFEWTTIEHGPGVQQEPPFDWDPEGPERYYIYTGEGDYGSTADDIGSRQMALDWLWRNPPHVYTPQVWCGDLHGAWCEVSP